MVQRQNFPTIAEIGLVGGLDAGEYMVFDEADFNRSHEAYINYTNFYLTTNGSNFSIPEFFRNTG